MTTWARLGLATIILGSILLIIWAVSYIGTIREENAINRQNISILTDTIIDQEIVISQLQDDQKQVRKLHSELSAIINSNNKDVADLRRRLTTNSAGEKRDIGKTAMKNPKAIEQAINNGTRNASRCIEIASGSELTDYEKNATSITDINKECPRLANPNFNSESLSK